MASLDSSKDKNTEIALTAFVLKCVGFLAGFERREEMREVEISGIQVASDSAGLMKQSRQTNQAISLQVKARQVLIEALPVSWKPGGGKKVLRRLQS